MGKGHTEGLEPLAWIAESAGTYRIEIRSLEKDAGVGQYEITLRELRGATDEEIRASALQFVRKLSGFTAPSRTNEAAFQRAVDEVSAAAHRLGPLRIAALVPQIVRAGLQGLPRGVDFAAAAGFTVDEDGFLYFVGRKDDIIKSRGEKVAPKEVESTIHGIASVREVAVIGMPDARWGETPVAIVVLGEGAVLELAALTDHCRARLAGFKVPKQLIIRDSLPRNPSGKVLKRVLRAELETNA